MECRPLVRLRCYLSAGIKSCLSALTVCCSCVGELEIKVAASSYSCTSNPGTFSLYFVTQDLHSMGILRPDAKGEEVKGKDISQNRAD